MKTMIAIPCVSSVNTLFMASLLQIKAIGEVEFALTESSLVYDARNALGRKAINEGFDRVLWLDSDMVFEPDIFKRLSDDLEKGYEMVSCLYFKRKPPIEPNIYSFCDMVYKDNSPTPTAISYHDYPQDSIFEIEACGFGGVMMTTSLICKVADNYGLPFSPILGFGEDLSFCKRVRELGEKIVCDSSIKMGHIGFKTFDENDFLLRGAR